MYGDTVPSNGICAPVIEDAALRPFALWISLCSHQLFWQRPSQVATQATQLHQAPSESYNRHKLPTNPKPTCQTQEERQAPRGPTRAQHTSHWGGELHCPPHPAWEGSPSGCPSGTESLAVNPIAATCRKLGMGPSPCQIFQLFETNRVPSFK